MDKFKGFITAASLITAIISGVATNKIQQDSSRLERLVDEMSKKELIITNLMAEETSPNNGGFCYTTEDLQLQSIDPANFNDPIYPYCEPTYQNPELVQLLQEEFNDLSSLITELESVYSVYGVNENSNNIREYLDPSIRFFKNIQEEFINMVSANGIYSYQTINDGMNSLPGTFMNTVRRISGGLYDLQSILDDVKPHIQPEFYNLLLATFLSSLSLVIGTLTPYMINIMSRIRAIQNSEDIDVESRKKRAIELRILYGKIGLELSRLKNMLRKARRRVSDKNVMAKTVANPVARLSDDPEDISDHDTFASLDQDNVRTQES